MQMCLDELLLYLPKIDISKVGSNLQKDNIIWSTFEYAIFYKREKYFQQILKQIQTVIKSDKCLNVEKKIAEISNFRNVDAFISEMKFAINFLDKGLSIDFILDDDPRFSNKSPDFFVKNEEESIMVEVRTAGEINRLSDLVVENLRDICEKLREPNVKISFKIDYRYPKLFEDIDNLLKITNDSVKEFNAIVEKNDYILEYKNYICGIICYEVTAHDGKKSIPFIGGPKDIMEIPLEPFSELVNKIINNKSKKSIEFDADSCYYIAVDFQHAFNHIDDLIRILYGKVTTWAADFLYIPNWKFDDSLFPETKSAIGRGWDIDFLRSVYLIPHDLSRIEEKGLFIINKNSKEISGLLSMFRFDKKKIYVSPNPFAKKQREHLNFNWLGDLPNVK